MGNSASERTVTATQVYFLRKASAHRKHLDPSCHVIRRFPIIALDRSKVPDTILLCRNCEKRWPELI